MKRHTHTRNVVMQNSRRKSTSREFVEEDPSVVQIIEGMINVQAVLPKRIPYDKRQSCLMIRQGEGGIYTFPTTCSTPYGSVETTSICTTGCTTCVVVYIPIDDNRCFACHFDGSLDVPEYEGMKAWQLPEDLVESFRDSIEWCLDRDSNSEPEALKNIRKREDLKDQAVIVCPWQTVGEQKATGGLFVDVLCDYFELDKVKVLGKQPGPSHGFVIEHREKSPESVRYLGWTRPGPSEHDSDQMAQLATGDPDPTFALKMQSIFRATYVYVMHFSLGWKAGIREKSEGDLERPYSVYYDFEKGEWLRG